MKRLLIFTLMCILTTLTFSQQFSQYSMNIQEIERYLDSGTGVYEYKRDFPSPGFDNTSYVGKKADTQSEQNAFRTIYTWVHNIPNNKVITSGELKIRFSITSSQTSPNDYVKLIIRKFPDSHFNKFPNEQWAIISSETTLHTTDKIFKSIQSGSITIPLDNNFIQYFQDNLSNGKFHLSFRAENEETFGGNNNFNYLNFKIGSTYDVYNAIKLTVNYEDAPPEILNITAKNKMDNYEGGNIGVGKNEHASSKPSPHPFEALENDDINLQAYENQIANGYNWIWNDTEAQLNKSKWEKELLTGSIELSNNQSTSYTVQSGDDGANLIANLKKYYKIDRKDDCSEFDNVINNSGVTYIVEQNNGTITAPTSKTVNGKSYKFAGWTDDLSKPNPSPLTPTDNEEYTALYKYPNHSNNINGFDNSSQKKMVSTPNGHLHMVYESMDRVWYEKSTDNGITWTLMNDGKPLSNDVSKYPSIDYYGNDKIIIAYNKTEQFKIVVKVFNLINPTSSYESVVSSSSDVTDISKPTVANPTSGDIIIIWDNNLIPGGLKYRHGYLYSTYIYWYNSPTTVPNTSHLSINASLAGCKNYAHPLSYWLAWTDNNQTIKVIKLDVNPSTHVVTFSQYHYFSSSGYTYNREPSISVMSDNNYRIVWIGEKTGEKKF